MKAERDAKAAAERAVAEKAAAAMKAAKEKAAIIEKGAVAEQVAAAFSSAKEKAVKEKLPRKKLSRAGQKALPHQPWCSLCTSGTAPTRLTLLTRPLLRRR